MYNDCAAIIIPQYYVQVHNSIHHIAYHYRTLLEAYLKNSVILYFLCHFKEQNFSTLFFNYGIFKFV